MDLFESLEQDVLKQANQLNHLVLENVLQSNQKILSSVENSLLNKYIQLKTEIHRKNKIARYYFEYGAIHSYMDPCANRVNQRNIYQEIFNLKQEAKQARIAWKLQQQSNKENDYV